MREKMNYIFSKVKKIEIIQLILFISVFFSSIFILYFLESSMEDPLLSNVIYYFLIVAVQVLIYWSLESYRNFVMVNTKLCYATLMVVFFIIVFTTFFLWKVKLSILLVLSAFFFVLQIALFIIYLAKAFTKISLLILGECSFLLLNYYNSKLDYVSTVLVGTIIFLAFKKMWEYGNIPEMKKYFTTRSKMIFLVLDICASFALVGHNAFMKEAYVEISLLGVLQFVLCLFITYPTIYLCTYLRIKMRNYCYYSNEKTNTSTKVVQLRCFYISFIPLVVMSFGYYPALITPDGLYQWLEAIGRFRLLDDHPAIHTLFLRLCSCMAETPFSVVLVQIGIFSLLWSLILSYFYYHGCKEKVVYFISLGVSLLPNNYMMLFLVSKNVLYALIILCSTFLFVRLYDDDDFLSWKIAFFWGVDLVLLCLVRHNGFVGTIISCLMLLIYGIAKLRRGKKNLFIRVIVVFFVMIVSISGIKGPLYKSLNVPTFSGTATVGWIPLVQAIAIFHLADEEMPNEVKNVAESIGTKEQWKENYDPYNSDKLQYSELRENMMSTDLNVLIKAYIELLQENPLLVIKARLNALDLMWNVVEPEGVYNVRCYRGISIKDDSFIIEQLPEYSKTKYIQDSGDYVRNNYITKSCEYINKFSMSYDFINSIIWRNGIYLVALLWILAIEYIEKRGKIFICGFVALGTLSGLMLAASWQMYQYYWFFPLSMYLLLLKSISVNSK